MGRRHEAPAAKTGAPPLSTMWDVRLAVSGPRCEHDDLEKIVPSMWPHFPISETRGMSGTVPVPLNRWKSPVRCAGRLGLNHYGLGGGVRCLL